MKALRKAVVAVAAVVLVQMTALGGAEAVAIRPKCNGIACGSAANLAIVSGVGAGGIWEANALFAPFSLTKMTQQFQLQNAPSVMSMLTAFDTTSNQAIFFDLDGAGAKNFQLEQGVTYTLGYNVFLSSPPPSNNYEYAYFSVRATQFIALQTFTYDTPDFTETVSPTGVAPVPEPSTMLLLGIGIAGIAGTRRIRQRMKSTSC